MTVLYKQFFVVISGILFITPLFGANLETDPELPQYKKVPGINGTLSSVGSDTLNNMMTLWFEKFREIYPGVIVQIEGKGSGTAPPALISGVAQLGPMSRAMKRSEIEKFENKYSFQPAKISVALDALGVFVNKDNPLNEISLSEVDAVFSSTRKGKFPKNITNWEQLGLSGTWNSRPISIYGRNSASGTYGFFKTVALFKGDFKKNVKEQPGSASVVLGVTEDRYSIGYSGIGFITSGVKTLALSKKKGRKAYTPNYKNVLSGKYPLGRALYVYFAKAPNKDVSPLLREFFIFILSKEGQEVVIKDGYLPLTAKNALSQRNIFE